MTPRLPGRRGGRRSLQVPRGRETRPTSARVREAIFDILGQRCDADRVLDLYAGTGALGIEAALRGAARVVWIDDAPAAQQAIRANLARVPDTCRGELLSGDALGLARALSDRGERFDLVFADPPYDTGAVRAVIETVAALPLLARGGTLVVEHSVHEPGPDRSGTLRRSDQRRYGQTGVSFYHHDEPDPPRQRDGTEGDQR